jgi:hypothetical protein
MPKIKGEHMKTRTIESIVFDRGIDRAISLEKKGWRCFATSYDEVILCKAGEESNAVVPLDICRPVRYVEKEDSLRNLIHAKRKGD